MIVALFAAAVLLADTTPAAAPTNPPPAAQAQAQPAKKKADDAQMVCHTEQVLGSRLPVKRCRTVEQAAADKASAREELDRAQGALANNPR
jgi:hypothetical protein